MKVKSGSMSLKEAGKEATMHKKLIRVKEAFMDVTKVESWQQAQTLYPAYTDEERLKQFAPKFLATCK